MPSLGRLRLVQALLGACSIAAAGATDVIDGSRRALQLVSNGNVVVNGVLNLHTTEGVAACEASCKGAFASAFGVQEFAVGCLCPAWSSSRRSLEQPFDVDQEARRPTGNRRNLRGLAELSAAAPVAFSARIAGGLAGGAAAIDRLAGSGLSALALAFGAEESEMDMTTLTVTPPSSPDPSETLDVITDLYDASDIPVVVAAASVGGGVDYAGGGRGVALFLAMLVLLVCTCCCCCVAVGLLWNFKGGDGGAEVKSGRNMFGMEQPTKDAAAFDGINGNRRLSGSRAKGAPGEGVTLDLEVQQGQEPTRGLDNAPRKAAVYDDDDDVGITHESDEAAGGGVRGRAPSSSAVMTPKGSGVTKGTGAAVEAEEAAGGLEKLMVDDDDVVPTNSSMEESRGTNPLFKSVAPLSASTRASQASGTPERSLMSTFLGNATPARLRRLAGRLTKSPSVSASSNRSRGSRHSRSGSSASSGRKHRRQGTFPGAYTQRNSSELDHQRPPADPVYTFMIKTIAAKGFKFMSTTEIAFCAMRMYSHFRRTEGNYKRLSVMQNAENVPPVYEIIWHCDGVTETNPQGESRFFSSTMGTDAEQQKSLLACLLALSWDGSASSRRTLQRALTPTRPSEVPSPEDIFWDEFKDHIDALSGDDEMVVLARVVLLVAGSSYKPGGGQKDGDMSEAASTMMSQGQATKEESNGVEHGDIMQALSGAHLREVGIALKEARPGWQEAHVQLVSVLLVIAYLEEGAKNRLPGGQRPDPLSSLKWVTLLNSEALDAFLVEKLEARRALVELDLEPSGLVIKHDEEGGLERVEPARTSEKKPSGSWINSRGHQKILPKYGGGGGGGRAPRVHRRNLSVGSNASSTSRPSPVVITTVPSRTTPKDRQGRTGGGRGGGFPPAAPSARSAASADSGFSAEGARGAGENGASATKINPIRTVGQQRSSISTESPSSAAGRAAASTAAGVGIAAGATAGSTKPAGSEAPQPSNPQLTIDPDDFAVRVPANGSSVRSDLWRGLSPTGSQTSSVVTRVYPPSSVDDQDRAAAAWALEGSDGRRSPGAESAMSQVSIAASRFLSSPVAALGEQSRDRSTRSAMTGVSAGTAAASHGGVNDPAAETMTAAGSTSAVIPVGSSRAGLGFSQDLTGMAGADRDARSRSSSSSDEDRPDDGFSDAASRYESSASFNNSSSHHRLAGSRVGAGAAHQPSFGLGLEPVTPTSAAGSRYDNSSPGSALTFTSRVGIGSPTAAAAGVRGGAGASAAGAGGGAPLTSRSEASSLRSDGGSSFFRAGDGSLRSGDSRLVGASTLSQSSWDEEDLQNIGTRWLADRAYNQQFNEKG